MEMIKYIFLLIELNNFKENVEMECLILILTFS